MVLTPFLLSGSILIGYLLGENTLSWQFLGQPHYCLCLPSEYLNTHLLSCFRTTVSQSPLPTPLWLLCE